MVRLLQWLGVFLAGWVSGAIGFVPVFSTGLFVHTFISTPLAVAVGALFAAVGASWAANLLYPSDTRSRLFAVLGLSEAAATLVIAAFFALTLSRARVPIPPLLLLSLMTVFPAIAASLAAARLRAPRHGLGRDALLSLGMIVLALALVVAAIFVASFFGLVGA